MRYYEERLKNRVIIIIILMVICPLIPSTGIYIFYGRLFMTFLGRVICGGLALWLFSGGKKQRKYI